MHFVSWHRFHLACTMAAALSPGLACKGDDGPAAAAEASSGSEGSTTTGGSAETTTAGASSLEDGSSEGSSSDEGPPPEPVTLTLLDEVIFYDGYAETVDEPVPEGVLRHNNSLIATPLGADRLELLQSTLKIGVVVGARCDNYDRLGGVNLAFVPRGAERYVPEEVVRLEVARFITPFMDMNLSPKVVPYEFEASNLLAILKDEALLAEYEPWFELYIFGVPYAANEEVTGCADRNDTQAGTLLLYSDSSQPGPAWDVLVPVAVTQTFNNYAEGASDAIGTTRKTLPFELPGDVDDAQLVLITSNHGANEGGEEYIRRDHFVYVDGELVHEYKPGRPSCEPFRRYNTQGNGIYGPSPRSDEEWQSFSNWCPGDVIDTRIIPWGAASAGTHEFVLDVPDATFTGGEGNFPVSLYVQAVRSP